MPQFHDGERRAADAASATFLFADIAGYTALTEAHGDEQAADLLGMFFDAVSEELPGWGGTHIEAIGDAIMLRIPDPAKAVLLGLRISQELLRGHGAPAVSVGYIREPIELFAAIPQGPPARGKLPVDPVCQMAVDPQRAVGRLTYEDTAYFFCTLTCAAEFAGQPERFISRSHEAQ